LVFAKLILEYQLAKFKLIKNIKSQGS